MWLMLFAKIAIVDVLIDLVMVVWLKIMQKCLKKKGFNKLMKMFSLRGYCIV